MASSTLDSSALLAYIQGEPGGEITDTALSAGAAMSTVNVAEVATKMAMNGILESDIRLSIDRMGLEIISFDAELAYRTAMLRPLTRYLGLSLGDRACLALAERLSLPVLTTDRAWANLALGITIQVIR